MSDEDIMPIKNLLASYRQQFLFVSYATARQWITEGADIEQDILPVIRYWTHKKADIYSLGFFTTYIRQAMEARLKTEIHGEPISIHERAKRIAFVTRRVGKCMPRETAWLEQYETEHGAVELDDKSVAASAGA